MRQSLAGTMSRFPPQLKQSLAGSVSRVPPHWRYALLVFAVSRVVLSVLGVLVRQALDGAGVGPPANEAQMLQEQAAVSPHVWYSMWFAWDAFQYRNLAEVPWGGWTHTGFPLLYPVLGKTVATALGGDTELALLLVSSVAYVVLLSYVYRWTLLVLGDPEDHAAARRACRYLALMPAAFLFHAPLTESLFVCLAVAAFYHAERRQWLVVGCVGYFAAMSRSVGFLIVIPLALLMLREREQLTAKAVALLMVPAGWLTFMAYGYWKVGDWFDYQNEQRRGWQIEPQNPLRTIWCTLTEDEPVLIDRTRLWVALVVIALAAVSLWRLHPAYAVCTVVLVLASMTIGEVVYRSLLRYLLVAFPLAALLASWKDRPWLESALACTQGVLFTLWIVYWTHTII